jgi:hypothetical protein
MAYSFARISAVVGMNLADYYQNGKRCWLRLHEKGGKFHEVPATTKPKSTSTPTSARPRSEKRRRLLFRTIPGSRDAPPNSG